MGFNDLFCLARPEVHTLSIGAARPSDFDAHVDALAHYDRAEEMAGPIAEALDAAAARSHGADWMARWRTGLPEWEDVPGGVNVVEILRMWTYGIGLGMDAWAKSRYNLLGNGGHWFPGMSAGEFDEAALCAALAGHPCADVIPARLRETHERFGAEAVKRLSQGG